MNSTQSLHENIGLRFDFEGNRDCGGTLFLKVL